MDAHEREWNITSLLRRALCELTGGHNDTSLVATRKGAIVTHVRLSCQRCRRLTRWFQVNSALGTPEPRS